MFVWIRKEKISRSDIAVQVIVDGTFSSLRFRPDMAGIIRQVPKETLLNIIKNPKKGTKSILGDKNKGKNGKNKNKGNDSNQNDNKPKKRIQAIFLIAFHLTDQRKNRKRLFPFFI